VLRGDAPASLADGRPDRVDYECFGHYFNLS
jgi:hypothetical protein